MRKCVDEVESLILKCWLDRRCSNSGSVLGGLACKENLTEGTRPRSSKGIVPIQSKARTFPVCILGLCIWSRVSLSIDT